MRYNAFNLKSLDLYLDRNKHTARKSFMSDSDEDDEIVSVVDSRSQLSPDAKTPRQHE